MKKILKAIFKTGSASIVSIIFGMLSTKIFAVVLGPAGVGLYSIIRQILITTSTIGTFGGQTALIQGLASRTEEKTYAATVFWLFLFGCVFITLSIVVFAPLISKIVFVSTDEHSIVLVRWIAVPTALMIISIYLNSLLNGYKAIGRLAIGQILLAMLTAALAYPVATFVKSGSTVAFIVLFSIAFSSVILFYLYIVLKEKWFPPVFTHFKMQIDQKSFKHFFSIAGTTIVTASITTLVLLFIKVMISQEEGLVTVGIFEAAWTLSMTYVMLLLGSFATYYLPALSATCDQGEKKLLMQQILRITILLIVPIIVFVILFKPLAVHLLYSIEFFGALDIIRWMLIGDYLKVISWVLAMPVLAYAEMKVFFITELLWNIGFLIIVCVALFFFHDLQGIGIAFMTMYILYFIYMLYYAVTKHQLKITTNIFIPWLIGLVVILMASLLTWNSVGVSMVSVFFGIIAISVFLWFSVTPDEKMKVIKLARSKLVRH